MTAPNPADIVNSIKTAVSGIIQADVAAMRGFSERQLKLLARQAVWISEAQLAGEFNDDEELRDYFLDNLQGMTEDFARTLRGLALITTEKIINATIDILWKAIEKAVGFALPRPI